ncbi:hypothetical protein BDV06DRAFT_205694 [Aspergillus oleicola]
MSINTWESLDSENLEPGRQGTGVLPAFSFSSKTVLLNFLLSLLSQMFLISFSHPSIKPIFIYLRTLLVFHLRFISSTNCRGKASYRVRRYCKGG